ncbi:MAG: transglutaminase-like domain-containing protein [Planctomycetota bacterium]|nr:transglutaminase-like domain-containing protein [Planctomycetota bacterium]
MHAFRRFPRSRTQMTLLLLSFSLLTSGCGLLSTSETRTGQLERVFHIRYVSSMKDCTIGDDFKLWIPVPHDDDHQVISNMKVRTPIEGTLSSESRFGNSMYYFEGKCSSAQMNFTIEYDVDRYAYSIDQSQVAKQTDDRSRDSMSQYLTPSSLCYVTPQVKREAELLTADKTTDLAKALAFFDFILDRMSYDQKHQGWGRGDISHACDVGKGNCTDFHTYFNALCLASGIPSRFQIGMWGKYESVVGEYQTGGYHCWAEFHVPGQGWIPVDISEADKDPQNAGRYFGTHSENRVTLSTGRDLTLVPRQAGPVLNYFVNPYLEINGRPSSNVSKKCFWNEIVESEFSSHLGLRLLQPIHETE